MSKATGTFEVKIKPLGTAADDAALGRMSVNKEFQGDLQGTSKGEMLTAGTSIKESAAYVAVEKVTGTLKGHSGSFELVHRGLMTRGTPQLEIMVVPDSGTEQLTGLSGRLDIKIEGGKHYYEFQYTLEGA